MLKRTKGCLLLALLVISGLAGTINDNSLSYKERKSAINLMKKSKDEVLNSVKGLSEAQLNYKAAPNSWSIKECAYHIANSEKNLWTLMQTAMKSPPNLEKRSAIKMTDEQLMNLMDDCNYKIKTDEDFDPKTIHYKNLDEALNAFKTRRTDHIKYMKSTTEDMRNHVLKMSFGWVDCYQLCLVMAFHCNRHVRQIEELKADPNYPRQ